MGNFLRKYSLSKLTTAKIKRKHYQRKTSTEEHQVQRFPSNSTNTLEARVPMLISLNTEGIFQVDGKKTKYPIKKSDNTLKYKNRP